MGINDDDVAAVRAASDIVQIVTEYTPLRRVGRQWTGLCPFHAEKTPSFSVNPNDNVFYCFGCQAKGDVIAFVMEKEALDFPGAVERLATKAGISLRYTDRNEGEGRKKRARYVETMARAVEWYHERLLSGPDAGAARSYLRARGLDGDVVREFRLGWAPDAWDELTRAQEQLASEPTLGRDLIEGRPLGIGQTRATVGLEKVSREVLELPRQLFDVERDAIRRVLVRPQGVAALLHADDQRHRLAVQRGMLAR